MAAAEMNLVDLCKLLLDEDRLKILGQVALAPLSVEELGQRLGIKERDLPRHLNQLRAAGFVQSQTEQGIERFTLRIETIHQHKRQLFAPPTSAEVQDEQQKTLAAFAKNGVLTQLPVQPGKLLLVLGWLAECIPAGTSYTEREINELRKGHTVDHVTLRRLLIDHQFMTREAGVYQRQKTKGSS